MSWYVCLSKVPKIKKVVAQVLSEKYVPKKGEKLQIVGRFFYKANAQKLAKYPKIQKEWGTALFVTDETMYDYLPSPDGR